MAKKTAYPTGVSSRGILQYPHLNKPDTKFDKVVFKVSLITKSDDEKTQQLMAAVDDLMDQMAKGDAQVLEIMGEEDKKRLLAGLKAKKAKPSDLPIGYQTDEEGNETGNVVAKFKKNGTYKDAKTGQVKPTSLTLVDAKKNPVKDAVWSGSEGKISYSLMPWCNAKFEYGVKLAMNAAQILALRAGGSGGDEFDEEDGYESASEASGSASSTASGSGAAADEF